MVAIPSAVPWKCSVLSPGYLRFLVCFYFKDYRVDLDLLVLESIMGDGTGLLWLCLGCNYAFHVSSKQAAASPRKRYREREDTRRQF